MGLCFYNGSGSPYAWRVWLALEFLEIPYEMKMLSFSAGDLKTAEYIKINPRQKVPAIDHNNFKLTESAAIVEYLAESFPAKKSLFPSQPQAKAISRQIIREIDEYFAHPMETIVDQLLYSEPEARNLNEINRAKALIYKEFEYYETLLKSDFFGENFSAIDLTLYPLIALCTRMQKKRMPDLNFNKNMGPRLTRWMGTIESLSIFEKTYPPHWRNS